MDDKNNDAELVALAQTRDREAFGTLAKKYQPMAQRVALTVVGQKSIADELANEAILQAYLSLDRLQDKAKFRSWLHGIVLNVCRSYFRERKRSPQSFEELMVGMRRKGHAIVDVEPTPQDVAESSEVHRIVRHAVECLPPKAREATRLYYYEQLTVREVADTLGMSASAVKNRLHSARVRLREVLLPRLLNSNQSHMTRIQEDTEMIEVKIIDVVEQTWDDVDMGVAWPVHVALLIDQERNRLLPIWVGEVEGRTLAAGLLNLETPRPLTFSFLAKLLEATDVQVKEIRIDSLKKDTYYAIVTLLKGESTVAVDARPSDAMALALHTETPIYATEGLLERAGVDIPANIKNLTIRTDGVRSTLETHRQAHACLSPADTDCEKKNRASETRREAMQKCHDELMVALFGD